MVVVAVVVVEGRGRARGGGVKVWEARAGGGSNNRASSKRFGTMKMVRERQIQERAMTTHAHCRLYLPRVPRVHILEYH